MALSDFGEERRAAVRARNNLNKRRSKTMETRVMRYLSGNRVPMSGSGSIKGDGQIISRFGYILVECKCTAVVDSKLNPKIALAYRWLDELKKDSNSMRASMGILIFHFHDTRQDYAVIEKALFEKYFYSVSPCIYTVDKSIRSAWSVTKEALDLALTSGPIIKLIARNNEEYLIMRIELIRDLLLDTNEVAED